MKNNLLRLNNATCAALEVLEELAELTTKLEHIQDLAIEVKGSGALPVEAREELEDIANACGVLIERGKE
tara:strand:+ start:1280 stop:1489 length:210 start_codon:yes stop_codon:yes gene_type:complete